MQLHEEALCIPVEPALADLVRVNLHERVVSTLFLHGQIESAQEPRVGTRPRGVCSAIEWKGWKEFIRDAKNNRGRKLSSEEMLHGVTSPGLSRY